MQRHTGLNLIFFIHKFFYYIYILRNSQKPEVMETRASKRRRIDNTNDVIEVDTSNVKVQQYMNATEPQKEILIIDDDEIPSTDLNVEIKSFMYKTPDDTKASAVKTLNMKHLISSFKGDNPEFFFEHCRSFMNTSNISSIEVLTIEQADTPIWHQMRFGRITASRIHQASRCKTKNGSLVDSIMGKRSGWSFAMQRGTNLEDKVFNVLKKEMSSHNLKKCGIYLDPFLPNMAASPDGIADTFVLEIKCPATPKTYAEYICVERLQRKYYGQIQLQMHITKRKRALLGVADLHFERNKKVTKVWIDYDEEYVNDLIDEANAFWINAIFPVLKRKHNSLY